MDKRLGNTDLDTFMEQILLHFLQLVGNSGSVFVGFLGFLMRLQG